MKRQTFFTISALIFFAIILSACNMPGIPVTTPPPRSSSTEPVQTAQTKPTNTQAVVEPSGTATQLPPSPTATREPTVTSTSTPTATPLTTPSSSTCTDLAKFVEDVSVPDDTEMLPGQEFIKTWRLQNVGTCTWTTQYAVVFMSGDQMNSLTSVPLSASVAPNATVDISVTMKAPGTTGAYRGDWKLKNASGAIFGLGAKATDTFYVKIKVVEGVSELNLGTATWMDNFANTDNWYLLDTANTKWTEGENRLVMTSITPGAGEEWGLSDKPGMQDYTLQATFITGSACSGRDKYGLLARAPDTDSGYVFEFSCDGEYRLYTWDGTHYHALVEWTASPSIVTGPNQTNIMGIYLKGTDIRLYANGHKLAELNDSTYDEGQFGLVIGSVNTQNFTVYVNQVAYWDLTP